ncbi:MAG: hypothetical protein R3F50_01240 [Gammaproteobacteria bacterium]|jgi:hypothetical protein
MSTFRKRALEQFPMVLLTLVSIIQALALELLWGKVTETELLWQLSSASLVGWSMISVTLLGILQIWIMYSSLVMGFRWVPSTRDSLFPFLIGIQEFMLVSLIATDHEGLWLLVLASIFASANIMSHLTFKRARAEPDNLAFFRNRSPATWRDFKWAYLVISTLTTLGVISQWFSSSDWAPLFASLLANMMLLVQIFASRRLWKVVVETVEE